jgi:GNAT superfamily N-acetyltransferase
VWLDRERTGEAASAASVHVHTATDVIDGLFQSRVHNGRVTFIGIRMTIAPLTEERFHDFVRLIQALANYEHLERPDAAAIERLHADALGPRPRFEAALAIDDGGAAVGYAIWFETYSSFLAKPTMFLEDLFVLEQARRSGAGGMLFEHVRSLGAQRGCGRMDWAVLDWNTLARNFYDRRKAQWMKDWLLYRLKY